MDARHALQCPTHTRGMNQGYYWNTTQRKLLFSTNSKGVATVNTTETKKTAPLSINSMGILL